MKPAPEISDLQAKVAPVVAAAGLELVHLELQGGGSGRVLRVYIDTPAGVTHGDCERVSRGLEAVLEAEPGLDAGYMLEVSSPGLDRPLVKPDDFERFAGERAQVETRVPLAGRRRFTGRIAGWRDGAVVMAAEGGEISLPWDAVQRARLAPLWPGPAPRSGKRAKK